MIFYTPEDIPVSSETEQRYDQRGTHAELIQQKGLYADFVSARQEAIGWKLAQ